MTGINEGRVGHRHRGRARHRAGPCAGTGPPGRQGRRQRYGHGRRRPGVLAGARRRGRRRHPRRRRARRWPTVTMSPTGTARAVSCRRPSRTFGSLDVVVNNAGILRDRMLANMSIEEWDAVISVHLRGTFATMRRAAEYWRDRSKAGGRTTPGSSTPPRPRASSATSARPTTERPKAGIAALTIIAAGELARYGVTVNAINPGCSHPHDRTGEARVVRRRSSRARSTFPTRRTSPRWSPGWPALSRRMSRGGCSRARRPDTGARRVARRAVGGRRSRAGTPPSSARSITGLVACGQPNADLWGDCPGREPGAAPARAPTSAPSDACRSSSPRRAAPR